LIFKLLEVSRHKSIDKLRAYVKRADLFEDHAGTGSCENSFSAYLGCYATGAG
jgi:hypothetical protein